MTFELRSSTERQGAIAVGARVQVRYRTEGSSQVATAVVADQPKQRTAAGETPPGR